MLKTNLTILVACLTLLSCHAGKSARQDTAAQVEARTQMLAENAQSLSRVKASVFPTGNKKLLEPDMLGERLIEGERLGADRDIPPPPPRAPPPGTTPRGSDHSDPHVAPPSRRRSP